MSTIYHTMSTIYHNFTGIDIIPYFDSQFPPIIRAGGNGQKGQFCQIGDTRFPESQDRQSVYSSLAFVLFILVRVLYWSKVESCSVRTWIQIALTQVYDIPGVLKYNILYSIRQYISLYYSMHKIFI